MKKSLIVCPRSAEQEVRARLEHMRNNGILTKDYEMLVVPDFDFDTEVDKLRVNIPKEHVKLIEWLKH